MENGVFKTYVFVTLVRKGTTFFEFIDDVIGHIVEVDNFYEHKEGGFDKQILESNFNSSTFADTYCAINISDVQMMFFSRYRDMYWHLLIL